MKVSDPLVTAEWLLEHLTAPDVRVVDASWIPPWIAGASLDTARRLYNEGHIPGATYFDIDEIADTDSDLPHMMPSPEKFTSRVRKLGLGDGNRIVVYDRSSFMASARVWWMFRLMGHDDVRVLDGGLEAWTAAGGALEDLPPVTRERHYTPRVQNHLIRSYSQVREALSSADSLVLDARPNGRFSGQDPEPRAGLPSGHMPNSINIPATSLLNADNTLKSVDALAPIFRNVGDSGQLIATCGSGVSAAIILLALQRLGRDDVALYDGSWSEYAAQPGAEIVTL